MENVEWGERAAPTVAGEGPRGIAS
jgi:hypothetical protein